MGLSIRAYARHRGVSDAAVRKAIKAGRITQEADGTIEAAKADRQWAANTDPAQQRETAKSSKAPQATAAVPRPEPPAHEALGISGGGASNTGGTSLLQAKTVNEVVKAQTNKVRLAKLKGELVERNQAIAHVFKLARAERDAWLNWPARVAAQMAASLGAEPHALHIVLENAVSEHLAELGNLTPKVD